MFQKSRNFLCNLFLHLTPTDSPSSSADSYSSSSSTRKLLSAPVHEIQTATTSPTTATIPTPSLAASRIIDIKVRDDKKISIEKAVDV